MGAQICALISGRRIDEAGRRNGAVGSKGEPRPHPGFQPGGRPPPGHWNGPAAPPAWGQQPGVQLTNLNQGFPAGQPRPANAPGTGGGAQHFYVGSDRSFGLPEAQYHQQPTWHDVPLTQQWQAPNMPPSPSRPMGPTQTGQWQAPQAPQAPQSFRRVDQVPERVPPASPESFGQGGHRASPTAPFAPQGWAAAPVAQESVPGEPQRQAHSTHGPLGSGGFAPAFAQPQGSYGPGDPSPTQGAQPYASPGGFAQAPPPAQHSFTIPHSGPPGVQWESSPDRSLDEAFGGFKALLQEQVRAEAAHSPSGGVDAVARIQASLDAMGSNATVEIVQQDPNMSG
mmetsp:Transcript_61203/g.162675  ORF Transcript_61203/g.162675 Transcript_61203/m.162675 type:complete len:340 (-) Transcript_61203:111-1130(-)